MDELMRQMPDGAPEPLEAPTMPDALGTRMFAEQGQIVVDRLQDVEPILDRCKELAASGQAWSSTRELLHLADFPMVLVERYMATKGIDFAEFMRDKAHIKAMLADPALADFRIHGNTVHRSYSD